MKYIELYERFYNPPLSIKKKLDILVQELLLKYGGGRAFFDVLDDEIKSIYNEDMILALFRGCSNEWIATSGGFGDKVYQLWKDNKFKCKGIVVFNGKIATEKKDVRTWYPSDFDISGKSFIYVDDSYFSGGTARKINSFLNEKKSKIKSIFVIYDGSKERSTFVKSFFRYHQ